MIQNPIRQNPIRLTVAAVAVLFATTLLATPALAQSMGGDRHHGMMGGAPMMGSHDGKSSSYKGGHHGMKGKQGHDFSPHNAAVHFLRMADMLELDDSQKARLRTLRDEWIEAHAVHTAQLKASRTDLKGLLFDDNIRMAGVEKQIKTMGELESGLWLAFAKQLQQIKGMMTDAQKARLKAHHERHHR